MIAGADSLLAADRVVLLGECHGSRQVPEAVVELAQSFAGPLHVGVEWPVELQPLVDAICAGRPFATSHELWGHGFGLTSAAMIAMIAALGARPETHVFAFNDWSRDDDELTARHVLAAYDAHPRAAFLVLAGNVHTQTQRANAPYKTLGEHLAPQMPVVAFDATDRGGTRWNATIDDPVGRVRAVRGVDRGDVPFVRWFDRPDDRGYDGELYVADVEASPPYV